MDMAKIVRELREANEEWAIDVESADPSQDEELTWTSIIVAATHKATGKTFRSEPYPRPQNLSDLDKFVYRIHDKLWAAARRPA